MFKKEKRETINTNKGVETIIGQSVKVKGNFHGQGNIIIEGVVEGSVKTNSFLFVGDRAKVTANVEAKEAKIAGEINGNIKTMGYVEIKSTAKINGNVESNKISIEKGAVFNGRCTMPVNQQEKNTKIKLSNN